MLYLQPLLLRSRLMIPLLPAGTVPDPEKVVCSSWFTMVIMTLKLFSVVYSYWLAAHSPTCSWDGNLAISCQVPSNYNGGFQLYIKVFSSEKHIFSNTLVTQWLNIGGFTTLQCFFNPLLKLFADTNENNYLNPEEIKPYFNSLEKTWLFYQDHAPGEVTHQNGLTYPSCIKVGNDIDFIIWGALSIQINWSAVVIGVEEAVHFAMASGHVVLLTEHWDLLHDSIDGGGRFGGEGLCSAKLPARYWKMKKDSITLTKEYR